MHKRDREKTAFNSHFGLYQLTKMSFGLHCAPATFQLIMEVILYTVKSKYDLVYLEDIVMI